MMPSNSLLASRLHWLSDKISEGKETHLSISYNPANRTQKIRFQVSNVNSGTPSNSVPLSIIKMIEELSHSTPIIDKGHSSHSKSRSVVEFWMKSDDVANTQTNQDTELLPPVPPPTVEPIVSPMLSTSPSNDYVAKEIPSSHDHMSLQIRSIAENVANNLCYTYCLYQLLEASRSDIEPHHNSSMQQLIDLQNTTITEMQGRQNVETKIFDKLEDISNAAAITELDDHINRLDRKITELIGNVDADQQQMRPSSDMVQAANVSNQDIVVDSLQRLDSGLEDASSEDPSDDEEFISLPASLRQASKFWQKRVFQADSGKGTVIDMVRGSQSGQVFYVVEYDGGDSDWLLRDEIKQQSAAYEQRRKKGTTSTEKASSSSSRRR
jgi:hypothetical protein